MHLYARVRVNLIFAARETGNAVSESRIKTACYFSFKYATLIGVGRFRIFGGGARFRILGGPRGAKFPVGT